MGTTEVRTDEGWVAEFCPFCRGPTWQRLIRRAIVATARLARGIALPTGREISVRHETVCVGCGVERDTRRARFAGVAERTDLTFAQLLAATNPGLAAEYADRLRLEEKVRRGTLAADERAVLLRQGMSDVERLAIREARLESTQKDDLKPAIGRACLLPVLLAGAFFATGLVRRNAQPRVELLFAAVAAAVLGLVYLAWYRATGMRRFYRREIVPLLVRTLAPLTPTKEELAALLAGRTRSPLTRAIDAAGLHRRIERRREHAA